MNPLLKIMNGDNDTFYVILKSPLLDDKYYLTSPI